MAFSSKLFDAASRNASSSSARDVARFFSGPHTPDSSLFSFYPYFFDEKEQSTLLKSCLKKLDSMEPHRSRRRARTQERSFSKTPSGIIEHFMPDNIYDFQEGHYDGVISCFREMHVTSWPSGDSTILKPILERLTGLVPPVKTQTHILHLGTDGQIFPHVDNLDASGSWILGVSLGSSRVLRMEKADNKNESFDVLLPSGSVYVQRDALRFSYRHSILKNETFRREVPTGGQRLSIMIRDLKLKR